MLQRYTRTPWGEESMLPPGTEGNCGGCAVPKGEFHKWGCDVEHCPACERQSLICGCPVAPFPYLSQGKHLWISTFVTLSEVCEYLEVSKSTFHRLSKKHELLRAARVGQDLYDLSVIEYWNSIKDVAPDKLFSGLM